jgi:hypothetical protein
MRRIVAAMSLLVLLVACSSDGSSTTGANTEAGTPNGTVATAEPTENILATARAGEVPHEATCPPEMPPSEAVPAEHHPRGKVESTMAFDSGSGRVVLVEYRYSGPGAVTWTFDVCTRTWARMDPRIEPPGAGPIDIRALAYDADSDLTVGFEIGGGTVWAYDVETDRWTAKGSMPPVERAVYDPVSGLIVAWGSSREVWAYDVETGTATPVPQGRVLPPSIGAWLVTYEASTDRFVLYVRRSAEQATTWVFDPREGWWTEEGVEAPVMDFVWGDLVSGGEIAYDASADRTLILSDGIAIEHDPASEGWQRLNLDPNAPHSLLSGFGHGLVYDAVNYRILVRGGRSRVGPPAYWATLHVVIELRTAEGAWRVISRADPIG